MKIAENKIGGPFDYAVCGEREEEAAAELEQRLEQISRDYNRPDSYIADDIAAARAVVSEKYGVTIKTTI